MLPVPHGHERARTEALLERGVKIPVGDVTLTGDLAVPVDAVGVVLFAHGSGSNRHSRRNRRVARSLFAGGIATLLLDLLTAPETAADEETLTHAFDLQQLAHRVAGATQWITRKPSLAGLPVGYFGGSSGAAAALMAAARSPEAVQAVVCRGGRTDLARSTLARVKAPTLLVVGSADRTVLAINREDLSHLACERELAVIEGATHLFAEPGVLDEVARLAARWFRRHFARPATVTSET